MYYRSVWKKLALMFSLVIFAGFMVACEADEEPGVNDNTFAPGIDPTPAIDPTVTPVGVETEVMEPTPMMEETPVAPTDMTPEAEVPVDEPAIVRGSDLIGAELVSMANEHMAEIDEVLFDENGDIRYAILNVDQRIGIGTTQATDGFQRYAVAWEDLSLSLERERTLGTTRHMFVHEDPTLDLQNAMGLEDTWWDNTWDTTGLFYQTPDDTVTDTRVLDGLYRLSAFTGFSLFNPNVVNPQTNENLGGVEDVLVNVNDETVSYAVASVGGFLGIGDTAVAIPWERLEFVETEEHFTIDVPEEELANAPQIDITGLDTWEIDTQWEQELEAYWNELAN